jgi:hypothetical protein
MVYFLFVCFIVNLTILSSVSNTEYTSWNEERKCIKNGKGVDTRCRGLILDITQKSVGKEREVTKNFSQLSRRQGRDPNREPPDKIQESYLLDHTAGG